MVINFAHFDASHASPFDVTASDFKLGIPKETSRESAAEVAYARSYEEPTPGSGDRPFVAAAHLLSPRSLGSTMVRFETWPLKGGIVSSASGAVGALAFLR